MGPALKGLDTANLARFLCIGRQSVIGEPSVKSSIHGTCWVSRDDRPPAGTPQGSILSPLLPDNSVAKRKIYTTDWLATSWPRFEILTQHYVVCLVHDCSISSALAMETLQSCTKPSKWFDEVLSSSFFFNSKPSFSGLLEPRPHDIATSTIKRPYGHYSTQRSQLICLILTTNMTVGHLTKPGANAQEGLVLVYLALIFYNRDVRVISLKPSDAYASVN